MEISNRIVCYIDVLGFSELIEKFEKTGDISIVKLISESFDEALNHIKRPQGTNKEAIKELHYSTFSDNIIISIPFAENELSFLTNFNIIATYAKAFQFIMIQKGFLTRGGLTHGKFYADENIIFSKALIDAYKIESGIAVYPRVVVDKKTIDVILKCNYQNIEFYAIQEYLIFDWNNTAFINYFNLLDDAAFQIDEIFKSIKIDDPDFAKVINPIVTSLSSITKSSLEAPLFFVEEEKKKILNFVLTQYNSNISEKIKSKYKWLLEFYIWLKAPNESMLKYLTIKEVFGKNILK